MKQPGTQKKGRIMVCGESNTGGEQDTERRWKKRRRIWDVCMRTKVGKLRFRKRRERQLFFVAKGEDLRHKKIRKRGHV